MWTQEQLVEDLREIGLGAGANVLAHVSLRAVGEIEGGAETLVSAFRQILGEEGTLLVPAFHFDHVDPAGWPNPPATPEDLERMRTLVPVPDSDAPASVARWTGVFAETVRTQPDAQQSAHPVLAFAAVGKNAAYLTHNAPFHFPLGSSGPLARLHQLDGYVLLIGVGHNRSSSIHLAEVWAQMPYTRRAFAIKTGPDEWATMQGSPECSEGFGKIEPLLRQCRVPHRGYIGNAPSELMRQRAVVSMAVALLQGDGSALLCSNPDCSPCARARRLTMEQIL